MIRQSLTLHAILAGCLLSGILVEWNIFHPSFPSSDGYHAQIASLAHQMPYCVGSWIGQDEKPLAEAVAMLHPNVIMERHYKNISSGLEADFLLVQCRDSRDLQGHYPPICYKSNGYVQQSADPCNFDSLRIKGMMYEFSSSNLAKRGTIKVFDFMILPDDQTTPDMSQVYAIGRDRRKRRLGAAQIQVVTNAEMSEHDRSEVIATLLGCAQPIIQTIRTGVSK